MPLLDAGAPVSVQGDSLPVTPPTTHAGKPRPPMPLLIALLIAATALPYLPALQYGFVYDDDVQVLQNVAARHSQSPLAYFLTSIWTLRGSAITVSYRYYRPLFHTWLHLNAALFGDHSFWWHFSAIAIHLCATLLVFLVIARHVQNRWSALVGALIFGVHPVHIESVAWISGVTDPLMAVGVLASFLLWDRNRTHPAARWLAGSLACYALALFCKETAFALPVILFAYVLFGFGTPETGARELGLSESGASGSLRRLAAALRAVLPFLVVTGGYWAIREAVLRPISQPSRPWLAASQVLLTAPSLLLFYLRHLVWPFDLRLFYDFAVVTSAASVRFWGSLLAIAAFAAALAIWNRRSYSRLGSKTIPLAAAWIVAPLLPVLDIALFARDDFAHDRYLYLPVVGLAILAGILTEQALLRARATRLWLPAKAALTLMIASLAGLTAVESAPWQSNLALYEHAARNSSNTLARTNLAAQYATVGRPQDAQRLLESAVRDRPDFGLAVYNLGYVDYRLGDLDDAEHLLDRAILLNPTDADAHLYRGLVALRERDPDRAMRFVRRAIALNPVGEGYHFALAVLLSQRDPEAAKSELREELKNYPANGLVKMKLYAMEHPTSTHATQPAAQPADQPSSDAKSNP